MSVLFIILFSTLLLITFLLIFITSLDIYYDGAREHIAKIIISIVLVIVTLLPIIPYVNISNTLTENLPSNGTVKIILDDKNTFVDKANSKVEKFISKYLSKDDVDIELKNYQTYYYIYINDKNGETIDYYYSRDKFDLYLLLKDSTLLE